VEFDIRPSALKHGLTEDSIVHAVQNPLLVDEGFEGYESPKVLVLGPDEVGRILELIGVFDEEERFSIFHAMTARAGYLRILGRKEQS
jgi:hypothetical protein